MPWGNVMCDDYTPGAVYDRLNDGVTTQDGEVHPRGVVFQLPSAAGLIN